MALAIKSRKPVPETASWYQSAVNQRRQTLFAPGIIPLFAGTMLLVLWIALPGKDLAQRLANAQRSDLLTIAYLKAWLTAKPDDLAIYLTLARHSLLLGGFDDALAALKRLPADDGTPIRREADQLKLLVLERKAYSLPEDSIERRALLAQIADELEKLARSSTTSAELRQLMERAQSLDNTALAVKLLRLIVARGIEPGLQSWFLRMAELAIGWGEPDLTLTIYWQAFEQTASAAEKRVLLMRIGRTMQAMNRTTAFLDLVDGKLRSIQPDKSLYEFLIRLALSIGRLDQADRYAHEMLRFSLWRENTPKSLAVSYARSWSANRIDRNLISSVQYRPPGDAAAKTPQSREAPPSNLPPALPPGSDPTQPHLPFDDDAYKLAYDVFLANNNQVDAYKVAAAAVRQVPANLAWRKRLAQIAEWTQQPMIALDQWLYLAEQGRDAEAWIQVRRLATALSDNEVLLSIYKMDARAKPGDLTLDSKIVDALEALGRPLEALDWLKERLQTKRDGRANLALMKAILHLAERIADDDLLVATLEELQKSEGPDPARAVKIATTEYRRKNFSNAFSALSAAAAAATPVGQYSAAQEKQVGFWSLYTELAKLQQREEDAWFGYQQLLVRELITEDLLADVSFYLDSYSTLAAAVVTEFAYRKYRKPAQLERLFALYLDLGDYAALQTLLNRFSPAERRRFEKNTALIRMRAQYYQSSRQFDLARKDMETLLALDPNSADIKSAMIWLLLAQKDAKTLRAALTRWSSVADREARLWGPFGAAYMGLNEPTKALPYFRRQARDHPDYLWWLAYADVLAENGLKDAAWGLRRRAWTELRRSDAKRVARQPEIRDRVVSLALQFAPGDPAKAVLQSLVNDRYLGTDAQRRLQGQDSALAERLPKISGLAPGQSLDQLPDVRNIADGRELLALLAPMLVRGNELAKEKLKAIEDEAPPAPAIEQQAAVARELALSYFLSTENFDTARAWLLSRYADELSRPAWAELSLALSHKDQGKISRLLDEMPDWLPKLESITGMEQTKRIAQAQTLAFETLESRPFSHDAHQKVLDTLLTEAPSLKTRYLSGYQGGFDFSNWGADISWRMPLAVTMSAITESTSLKIADPNLLGYAPEQDRTIGLTARGLRDNGWWLASVAHRSAMTEFNTARFDWQQRFDNHLQTLSSVGFHQPAGETPALRVAGMKDFIETRATFTPGHREYLVGYVHLSRLLAQSGTVLGSGRTFSIEAGHRLRTEYPDITVRAGYSNSQYDSRDSASNDPMVIRVAPAGLANPIDSFVPKASNEFSVNASYGESARSSYSRALRPFGELGLRRNSITGAGFSLRTGLTTSLIGADRLSLFFNAVSATPGNSRGLREVGMAYQWLY